MNIQESQAWRPNLSGSSWDILPYYQRAARLVPAGAVCVEIGVAWGRSTIFLASELFALGNKTARIYAVDTWIPEFFHGLSSITDWPKHASRDELELIHPVRMDSARAARLFDPGSLDLVFVDGDHSYDGCAGDIRAYLPLVKPGGIIAGHDFGDFERRTFGLDRPVYDGVERAVREAFGDKFNVYGSVWEHVVS